MAKITDPDSYSLYVHETSAAGATTEEIIILTGPKTVQLRVSGNLNDTAPGKTSGGTAKSAYSFLKEEYLNDSVGPIWGPTLRRFKFPLKMIFEGSFIWVNGWSPADDQTRDLFRDAGFQEGVTSDIYSCLISLGAMDDPNADLAYYTQAAGFTEIPTVYDKTGELNENIIITGSTTYQKSFLREQGKLYSEYNLLNEQGLSSISFQAYSFPLSNGTDLKVSASDATIGSTTPYTNMEVNFLKGSGFTTWANTTVYPTGAVVQALTGRWFFTVLGGTSSGTDVGDDVGVTDWVAYYGEELIGSTYYAFNRVITCATGTDVQSYEFMQYQLRQAIDINADNVAITAGQGGFGTVNGDVAALLAAYVGDTLKPKPGVVLRGFDANSTNNIIHSPIDVDTGGLDSESVPLSWTETSFPFVAAGNFNFSSNLDAELDAETYYTVYFDYITQVTSIGIAITAATGSSATFDYTADVGALDHLSSTIGGVSGAAADYIYVTGFTTAANNGLWILTGDPTTNTFTATKQDGATVVNEVAGDSIVVNENPFESPEAFIVEDNSATAMNGEVTAPTIAWDFDYTNNDQGGRKTYYGTAVDAAIRVVAQALTGAEWTEATHTITASTGQNIAINAGDERNYENA